MRWPAISPTQCEPYNTFGNRVVEIFIPLAEAREAWIVYPSRWEDERSAGFVALVMETLAELCPTEGGIERGADPTAGETIPDHPWAPALSSISSLSGSSN